MSKKLHFAAADGSYLGQLDDAPEGAVEVSSAPERGDQLWSVEAGRWVRPMHHYVAADDGIYVGAFEAGTQPEGCIAVPMPPEDVGEQRWANHFWQWTPHYCRDGDGNFLGIFDAPSRPEGAIDCIPPADGRMKWDGAEWRWPQDVLHSLMVEERNRRIAAIQWRYERQAREVRLGLTPTDDIAALDTYVQALADVPAQPGFPSTIEWPVAPD